MFEEIIFTRAEGIAQRPCDYLQIFVQLDAAEKVVSIVQCGGTGCQPSGIPIAANLMSVASHACFVAGSRPTESWLFSHWLAY